MAHANSLEQARPRAKTAAQSRDDSDISIRHSINAKHVRAASELKARGDVQITPRDGVMRRGENSPLATIPRREAYRSEPPSTHLESSHRQKAPLSPTNPTLDLHWADGSQELPPRKELLTSNRRDYDISDTVTAQLAEMEDEGSTSEEEAVLPENGKSFDELVDRLLAFSMSRVDVKFVNTFLCFYRMFAVPARLLASFTSRFTQLSQADMPQLLKAQSQLRYLGVLSCWVSSYPGDFAHPSTRHELSAFVTRLAANRLFATAAHEISRALYNAEEDDDTIWGCSDIDVQQRGAETEAVVPSSPIVAVRSSSNLPLKEGFEERQQPGANAGFERLTKHSKSSSTVSSDTRTESLSGSSISTPLDSVEISQRRGYVATVPQEPLTKVQWRQFMELSDDDLAQEMTRIDWAMYASIRPRDLIRHVSSSARQKERYKNLEFVSSMIDHFNHVAFWVSHMVLLRDKAKHRAKALEKFMSLAWRLRQLNNYNSLAAIIAGVGSTAIHRLAQTRDLVLPEIQKQYMRLQILMGTQRSHAAYRLAWANTSGERIPFLPLHRRDLTSAESGNRTFVEGSGGRVNWHKFDILGNIVLDLQESQETYPQFRRRRNPEIQQLILGVKLTRDEDELYERSLQVEGLADNEPRKRFNWFQK